MRKTLYMNCMLNRVQRIYGHNMIKINLSDYNIYYIIDIRGVGDKESKENLKSVFTTYDNSLILHYDEVKKSKFQIRIDYFEKDNNARGSFK